MSLLRSKFLQAVLVVVAAFLFFRYGMQLLGLVLVGAAAPAPWSVLKLYMAIVLAAVLVYVSSDSDSWRAFLAPIRSILADDSKRPIRFGLMVFLPGFFGYYSYTQVAAKG